MPPFFFFYAAAEPYSVDNIVTRMNFIALQRCSATSDLILQGNRKTWLAIRRYTMRFIRGYLRASSRCICGDDKGRHEIHRKCTIFGGILLLEVDKAEHAR